MSKVNIPRATEIKHGYVVCPGCDSTQGEYVTEDFETGTYRCDAHCGELYTVDYALIESKNDTTVEDLRELVDNLVERIHKIERELGFRPK